MLSIFSCICWPSICFPERDVYLSILSICWLGCLFFILSYMSFLFILEINHLSVVSFANIFSHSSGHFFILFMISFTAQKLLSLIGSHFCFIFITLGCGLKKILLWFMSKSVCLFSSISFVVSGLTFMSLIHFEFIFVYGIRVYSNFTLLHVAVQFSNHHSLKRLSFLSPLYILASFVID